jgi:S-adenosylmethionine-diacylglycerol 3-amino-3-carboxypropyl transferase
MTDSLPWWVTAATGLPVAFAQVREDPRIDRYVVERAGPRARVCMVASGGCTAAVLATVPNVAAIHLVDPNSTQLALARVKLHLLGSAPTPLRLAVMGHSGMDFPERLERLNAALAALNLPPNALGSPAGVALLGPDRTGRYEQCFGHLVEVLAPNRAELDATLQLTDCAQQARRTAPVTPLGRALDDALDSVMSLPNLVALFGEGATRNPVEPFARHFAHRIRHCFATLPAASNPFLWQMLARRYPDGHPADWFELPAPRSMPEITWQQGFMADALREHAAAFDVVHLSNILDWLSPEEATATLELAARAMRANGRVIIRQLNSTLDIQALGPMFEWDRTTAAGLHANDRSFFYRALHMGRKP